MTDLILAFVAIVVLLGMIQRKTYRKHPQPFRWLALGLGIILVTNSLGWIAKLYLSRTLTLDTFATAHVTISALTAFASAIALVFMTTAVFASREKTLAPSLSEG